MAKRNKTKDKLNYLRLRVEAFVYNTAKKKKETIRNIPQKVNFLLAVLDHTKKTLQKAA